MNYDIPDVQTLNKELHRYKYPEKLLLKIPIIPDEEADVKYHLLRKARTYIGVVSKKGLIISVLGINKIIDNYGKNGYFIFNVEFNCQVFNPKAGDIILGCKITSKTDQGLFLSYNENVRILIGKSNVENYDSYKIGHIINIQVLTVEKKLNSKRYSVKFSIGRGKIEKSILSTKINILEPNKVEYTEYLPITRKEVKKTIDTVIDITSIKQFIIIGKPFIIWDMPHKLRYIQLKTNFRVPEIVPNFTNQPDTITYKYFAGFKNPINVEKYELFQELRNFMFDNDLWNKRARFTVYPYELLRPRLGYGRNLFNPKNDFWKPVLKISEIPVSRAFFKLWEILHSFNLLDRIENQKFYTLGDAPGGFAQVLSILFPKSQTITFSLNKELFPDAIPYNKTVVDKENIVIDYLSSNTGDLLDIKNVIEIIEKYNQTGSIVACDGALSYEEGIKAGISREVQHTKLMLSEIIISLHLLKLNGMAIIKLFGRYREPTGQIFYLMADHFETLYVYKLQSLYTANGEIFIIGHKLKKRPNSAVLISLLRKVLSTEEYLKSIFNQNVEENLFFNKLSIFNFWAQKIRYFLLSFGFELIKVNPKLSGTNRIIRKQIEYINTKFAPKILQ